MNGALPAGAEGYRWELEGFLPSHGPAPERKPVQFMDFEGKTVLAMSLFNLSNAIMGSGILGLACALAHTGVLFLALELCLALCSSCFTHLLLTCTGVVGIRAYEQLGQRASGPVGRVVAATIICLCSAGAMSSYTFVIKSELPLVIGAFLNKEPEWGWLLKGIHLIILVSMLIILPLALMVHLGCLGYTSSLSLTCMLFFPISVMYEKVQICCGLNCNGTAMETVSMGLPSGLNNTCEAQMFTGDSRMAHTVPIMAFAFVCHPAVLPIYMELSWPPPYRMQTVTSMVSGAVFCMHGLTATSGYLTFHSSVKETLHTHSRKDPLICVRLAVLLALTLAVPIVLFPIRRALQQLLFLVKAFSCPQHVLIALLLLLLVNVFVICVKTIQDIFGVIGSTCPSLIFILPSILYLCIVPSDVEPLCSWPKIQTLCFGILGVLFMAISLGFMFANWATGHSRMWGY
ncbi:LOW QUALITY PROTEIN: sodium-coupled neutral amino acid transporter 5 [Erethizon dorsatum]